MKRFIFCLLAAHCLLLAACTTLTPAQREAQRTTLKQMLSSRHYTIDVNMMYPQRGAGMNVASNWSLEVKGDTLVSYLPYMGESHSVPYGGGKGMNFTAPISTYKSSLGKKGETVVEMVVNNEEDILNIRVEIQDGGDAFIDVTSKNRDRIGYGGQVADLP